MPNSILSMVHHRLVLRKVTRDDDPQTNAWKNQLKEIQDELVKLKRLVCIFFPKRNIACFA